MNVHLHSHSHPHSIRARPRSRAGFSAVELLVVLGIVMILATMAIPAIVPALRRGQVNDAATAIVQIARQARLMAMQRLPPANNFHYGVAIIYSPPAQVTVALIYGTAAQGAAAILQDVNSKPIAMEKLARSVMVYSGDKELRSNGNTVCWYYQYRTGVPIGPSGGSFTTTPISVGCPAITVSNVWGSGLTVTAGSISPGTAAIPGLSVRSVDDKIRRAIAIYVSGIPVTGEF